MLRWLCEQVKRVYFGTGESLFCFIINNQSNDHPSGVWVVLSPSKRGGGEGWGQSVFAISTAELPLVFKLSLLRVASHRYLSGRMIDCLICNVH